MKLDEHLKTLDLHTNIGYNEAKKLPDSLRNGGNTAVAIASLLAQAIIRGFSLVADAVREK